MATLGEMVSSIATEMFRDDADFPSYVRAEIKRAIAHYQRTRFHFNETRGITFNTVAGQDFYGAADEPRIPNLLEIDYIQATQGGGPYAVTPTSAEAIDIWSGVITSGWPSDYVYYEGKLRFYPTPASVYPVRIAALVRIAAPATDDEADNPWMTDAEELIRSRAKRNLYLHYLANTEMGAVMKAAEDEALSSLKREANARQNVHTIAPSF